MWEYRHTDELYHYGRKGMKWGQHIFGKIKTAINNSKAKRAEAKAEKQKALEEQRKRNRPISELSDAELKERKARLQLEKDYLDLQSQVAKFTPAKVNKGKQFANKFMNEALQPALVDAGKKLLENVLNESVNKLTGSKDATKSAKTALEKATEDLRKMRDEQKAERYRGYVDRGGMTDAEMNREGELSEKWRKFLTDPNQQNDDGVGGKKKKK
jgi:hypothetical protein